MRISLIAAVATNGTIGRNNDLPWHMGADLKRFKALTTGHHFIMGRRTFESIGSKPLPNRTNVIVTRDPSFRADGVKVTHSLAEAIHLATEAKDDEVFIGGGADIFEQAVHNADRMYITRVHAEVEGDTFFPDFDDVSEWHLTDAEHFDADEKNDYPYSFLTYDRVASAGHAIPEDEE
jgi:dihydrofolate reductase